MFWRLELRYVGHINNHEKVKAGDFAEDIIFNFVSFQNLKQQKTRRDQFSQGPLSSSLPPSALSGHHHGSVLLAEEQVSIDMEEGSPLLPPTQKQAMIYDETVCTNNSALNPCFNRFQMALKIQLITYNGFRTTIYKAELKQCKTLNQPL